MTMTHDWAVDRIVRVYHIGDEFTVRQAIDRLLDAGYKRVPTGIQLANALRMDDRIQNTGRLTGRSHLSVWRRVR